MGKTADADPPPPPVLILEGVGWKRRSGFGKYSDAVAPLKDIMGSSWERRRFALTANPLRLSYYSAGDDSSARSSLPTDESPRGTLNILPERVTITATYPADATQPTPFAVALKTVEGEKWKFCFDDRETQLLWLVALADIVAQASVREFNAKVLNSEADKSTHGGFHRMYEEGDGRLLDLVHTALLSGGMKRVEEEEDPAEGAVAIEVVRKPPGLGKLGRDTSIRIVNTVDSSVESATAPAPKGSPKAASPKVSFSGGDRKEVDVPIERLYQALAVVVLSVLLESCAEMSSSLLWKIVNVVILCVCFFPKIKKSTDGKQRRVQRRKGISFRDEEKELADSRNRKTMEEHAAEATRSILRKDSGGLSRRRMAVDPADVTLSKVSAELMKAEGVPLSDVPSFSAPPPAADGTAPRPPPDRVPLTEEEMASHAHERWAVSSPDVDLTGQWTLIADDAFKSQYDAYLKQLGFGGITRRVACQVIGRTSEETRQGDQGRELYLKGTNPKGAWERTLTASGYPDFGTETGKSDGEDYEHVKTSIKTADSEDVDAEAWWEERGTKHRSWLRGGKKYGGGDFESLRYIEDGSDGKVLVCESIFHPKDASKKKAVVTWRFQRDE